ncbi:MAG TPA: hypothetical protein VJQ56_07410 [Blastocatellia bacterium]|nr:hypothetical protein [Blastocatellia bacterium]
MDNYQRLGNRLIQICEQAHALRDFDKVREIGRTLSNLPVKSFQSTGYYFLAIAANNLGQGDQEEARRLLERAAECAPARYKAKACLSLAAVSADRGDYESELYYYNQVLKVDPLSPTAVEAVRGMAIFKACEGYHRHAVDQLEQLLPVVRYAPRHIRLTYLNSYAVELYEVGRLEEARRASLIAASSPLAQAYPEWQRTFAEVNKATSKRSTVAVSVPKPEPLKGPGLVNKFDKPRSTATASKPQARAKVLAFPKKEKPLNQSDTATKSGLSLTPLQILGVILKVVFKDRVTDEEIDRVCAVYYEAIRRYNE